MSAPLFDDRAFSAVFEGAAEGILLADDDARYLRVNPAAERLTGYSGEELCRMTVFDLTPPPDREQGLAAWREFIRFGSLSGEYALTRKDGSQLEVDFEAVASILPGVHLSIVRDATERRREERRLRRAARLQEVTAQLSAASDLEEVARAILDGGLAALDAPAGHVVRLVEGGRWTEVVATVGMDGHEEKWAAEYRALGLPLKQVGGRYRFAVDERTLVTSAFARGDSIRVLQIGELDPRGPFRTLRELGSTLACLPLVVGGELVGGLYLFLREHPPLGEDEQAFAVALAGLCAQALARARSFTAEREARQRAVASERTVLEHQERLKRMAFDHVVREEGERRRIAAALHDGVTQYLALAKMTLEPLRQRLPEGDRAAIDAAIALIDDSIAETRSLSFELSPPILYDLGLVAALSWLAERLEHTSGLRVEIEADGMEPVLDDVTASIVFRAVRELLMNVVKHAKSPTAAVRLGHDGDALEIVVEDVGVGFDSGGAPVAGFGLMSVREEIGRLDGTVTFTSVPGDGTRARILVPRIPSVTGRTVP